MDPTIDPPTDWPGEACARPPPSPDTGDPSTSDDVPLEPFVIPPLVRAFLRQDYQRVDTRLPGWLDILSGVGAGECWHKKSSFKAHLFEVYKICKMWGQDEDVCRCALFHSAYSNSYVNLAVFKEGADRGRLQEILGASAEELTHTFCVVHRHKLVYDKLLPAVPPEYGSDSDPAALRRAVPEEGVVMPHIHTGEAVTVDRLTCARFLAMTMADFCEQLFSWQDAMFENSDGRLQYAGSNAGSLWPGAVKPGLWHSALSRMGALLRHGCTGPDGAPLVPLPPVFANCTQVLSEADQLAARDAYWEAVTQHTEPAQHDAALRLLRTACWHNPHVAEPHVLLAQIHAQRAQHGAAARHAQRALRLFCEWGTAWDKRMSWEVWVAMARVLLHGAQQGVWPTTPFGMLNLGLVPDLDEPYGEEGAGEGEGEGGERRR